MHLNFHFLAKLFRLAPLITVLLACGPATMIKNRASRGGGNTSLGERPKANSGNSGSRPDENTSQTTTNRIPILPAPLTTKRPPLVTWPDDWEIKPKTVVRGTGKRPIVPIVGSLPRDCADVQRNNIGSTNGIYRIYRPSCLNAETCGKDVSCDLSTDGGGWTVIQQRIDGSTDFFRDWLAYRNGFGNTRSFWIGNEYLYEVTNMLGHSYHLLVQINDFNGQSAFALYNDFLVSDERSNYSLSLGQMFSAGGVDNLRPSRGAPFGTYDHDTDENSRLSCGAYWQSGWWHDPLCRPSGDMNVPYEPSLNESSPFKGIRWRDVDGSRRIMTVHMKIRPKTFEPIVQINIRSRHPESDDAKSEINGKTLQIRLHSRHNEDGSRNETVAKILMDRGYDLNKRAALNLLRRKFRRRRRFRI